MAPLMRFCAWANSFLERLTELEKWKPILHWPSQSHIPTYFIGDYGEGAAALLAPAKAKAAETGIPMDGVRICDNLLWLKGSGILNLKGLRVAYLSGKHSAELYQNAKAAAAAGAHHEDDVDTLRAFADDPNITDLFLSYPLLFS
ncbi:unnamed protein product [Sphagnum balticum]